MLEMDYATIPRCLCYQTSEDGILVIGQDSGD